MLDAGKKDLAETQMDDRFVYANQGGFVYFEKMDRLEIEIQKINAKLKESEEKHRESEKKHQESEQRHRASERQIRALTESSEGYQKVRSRFLSTYLRDILGAKPVEQHIISAGNRAAHDGDVIADASLYIKQDRTDTNTFVELYGITPALAAELGKKLATSSRFILTKRESRCLG